MSIRPKHKVFRRQTGKTKRPRSRSRAHVDEIAALGSDAPADQFDPGRHEPSYRIREFCDAERISRTTYYALQELGLGPKEIRPLGLVRVTHRARIDWQDKMANLPPEVARAAQRQLNTRAAAAKSIKSPRHQSNRKRGTHAATAAPSPARFEEHERKRRGQPGAAQ